MSTLAPVANEMICTTVMMNDHPIYDYILQDDVWMGVLGMLECE